MPHGTLSGPGLSSVRHTALRWLRKQLKLLHLVENCVRSCVGGRKNPGRIQRTHHTPPKRCTAGEVACLFFVVEWPGVTNDYRAQLRQAQVVQYATRFKQCGVTYSTEGPKTHHIAPCFSLCPPKLSHLVPQPRQGNIGRLLIPTALCQRLNDTVYVAARKRQRPTVPPLLRLLLLLPNRGTRHCCWLRACSP